MIQYQCPTCRSPLWGRLGVMVCTSCPSLVLKMFAISVEIPDTISEINTTLPAKPKSERNVKRQGQTEKKGKGR